MALALVTVCATSDAGGAQTEVAMTVDRVFLQDELGSGATAAASGRVVGLWFMNLSKEPLRVDTAHVRIALTCLHFCASQAPLALRPRDVGVVASRLGKGDRATVFVPVSIPDDFRSGVFRVTVIDDGHVARTSDGRPERLPLAQGIVSIPPVGWRFGIDENLRTARAEYVGKTVQGFGPIDVDCDDPESAAKQRAYDAAIGRLREIVLRTHRFPSVGYVPSEPITSIDVGNEPSLVIAQIDRPSGAPLQWWRLGGPVHERETTEAQFTVVSPLKITFTAASFGKHGCTNPRLWVADTWELRRLLWVHAPVGILGDAQIKRGMTKLTVAHVLGFPVEFGTVNEMLRLDTWQLPPVLMPFHSTVHFRNGRVSNYEPPGELP